MCDTDCGRCEGCASTDEWVVPVDLRPHAIPATSTQTGRAGDLSDVGADPVLTDPPTRVRPSAALTRDGGEKRRGW